MLHVHVHYRCNQDFLAFLIFDLHCDIKPILLTINVREFLPF